MFGFGRKKEVRESFTQSSRQSFAELVGLMPDGIAVSVTNSTAMSVPAVWAAVNFISGTIAGLPLHVYERTDEGRKRVESPLTTILNRAASDEMTSFDWRKYKFERVFTGGRGITHIQKNVAGRIAGLYPLDPSKVQVVRRNGRKLYVFTDGSTKITYSASEIIDIPFSLKEDGISHFGPVATNKESIGLAMASEKYAARFYQGGGVPPFAVSGNFQSKRSLETASNDMAEAIKKASTEGRQVLTLPDGLTISKLGSDMDKTQFIELQRFSVEQIARIYSLPPTFLQDLTNGTFSNTEQQDLHFVKHTLKRWIEQFEQELNLKLFGRNNNKQFVEFSMEGLLRGDFKTRMEGYAQGVQNGILKPNEARELENRPPEDAGNQLMIQGATVPIGQQPTQDDSNQGENDGA